MWVIFSCLLLAVVVGCSDTSANVAKPNDGDDLMEAEDSAETKTEPDAQISLAARDAGKSDAGQHEAAKTDAGTLAMPPAPAVSDDAAAQTLVGSYAAMIQHRDVIAAGVAGTASMVTTVLATAELRDDPKSDGLLLDLKLCKARTAGDSAQKHLPDLTMTVPPEVLTAMKIESPTVSVTRTDGQIVWRSTQARAAAGWKPSSPSDDQLPESDGDPRVFDQDNDGFPGVSVLYAGEDMGSLYLAMMYRWVFAGSQADNGDLIGTTTSTSSETLLGSTEFALVATGATIEREPDEDTADNKVRFVRQQSPLTCEVLLALEDVLF